MRFLLLLFLPLLFSSYCFAGGLEDDFKNYFEGFLNDKGYTEREIRQKFRDLEKDVKKDLKELEADLPLHFLFYKNKMKLGDRAPALEVLDEEYVLDLKTRRKIRSLVLTNTSYRVLNQVKITLSLPENFDENSNRKYPVLFILPGFTNDKNAVKYIENPGEVILVGYDFTFQNLELNDLFSIDLIEELVGVGAQVSAALSWLKEKSWVNEDKMNLMGVSFGGIMLPVAQHYSKRQGVNINSSIVAYAAGDIHKNLQSDLEKKWGKREARIVSDTLGIFLLPIAPKSHMPYLNSSFLYLTGSDDSMFTESAVTNFYNHMPKKKEHIVIEGGHINHGKEEIIEKLIGITSRWLIKNNAL